MRCRPGDTTATGQKVGKDCSALQVLREAGRRTEFSKRRRALKGSNRGIGLSLFFHGSGFTGGGEVKLASKASLALTERGVQIRVASTEIGQGTRTMHAQIVADTLGIPYDQVEVSAADTATVPDSGPTVASRTCMVVGRMLQRCAEEMRERLGRLTPAAYCDEARRRSWSPNSTRSRPASQWDDDTYRGDAYGSYGWACDVVEVEVDPITYQATPVAFTTVHEIGRAIHPLLAAGQIEGGSVAGARLRAARGGRHARRPDGQRAADQLHHPDDARHAADDDRRFSRTRTSTGRSARKASARCRSTARRPRSSTRSGTRASTCARFRRRRRRS